MYGQLFISWLSRYLGPDLDIKRVNWLVLLIDLGLQMLN